MNARRLESVATALTIGVLCLVAMAGGVSLLRLSAAEAQGRAERFRSLIGDPYVGAAAAFDLVVAEGGAAPAFRARDLEALLRRAPLTSGAWLELAVARRASGEDFSRVTEALRLSAATGPREAKLMAGRAAFALSLWPALPDDLREREITDLAGVGPYLQAPERQRLSSLIGLQSATDVKQICEGLRLRAAGALWGCEAP